MSRPAAPGAVPRTSFFAGQPRAVYLIFGVEFWERFSYYGFLSILVLWLTAVPTAGGLGWGKTTAVLLVGNLVGAVWIAPIAGGWIADRWIGARRAIQLGGLGLAGGNALLATAALSPARNGALITALLGCGLAAMVLGAGLFKSNASSLLSAQFAPDDPRRGKAFMLFYMGINLGALAAPFVVGTLGEKVGWGYGFAAAAAGMALGTLMFALFAPHWLIASGATAPVPNPAHRAPPDRSGIWTVLALIPFAIVFWSGFQQYSGAVSLFTADHVRRDLFGFVIPASWFNSINPAVILLGGPFLAILWARADARAGHDVIVLKVVAALVAMAMAFALLVGAAMLGGTDGTSPLALVGFWLFLTIGELSLMPAGLALIGRVAPPGSVGTLMGVWLLTLGVGGVVAGWIGAWSERVGPLTAFRSTAVGAAAAALLLLVIGPALKRRIGRIEQNRAEETS